MYANFTLPYMLWYQDDVYSQCRHIRSLSAIAHSSEMSRPVRELLLEVRRYLLPRRNPNTFLLRDVLHKIPQRFGATRFAGCDEISPGPHT